MTIPTCSVRLAPDGRHALLQANSIHTQTLTAVAQTLAADAYEETATALYEVAKVSGFELRDDPSQYGQQTVRDSKGLQNPSGESIAEAVENVIDHIGRDAPVEVLEVADVDRLIGQLIAVRSRMLFDAAAVPFFEPTPDAAMQPSPVLADAGHTAEISCPNPEWCTCAVSRALRAERDKPVCLAQGVHSCTLGRRHAVNGIRVEGVDVHHCSGSEVCRCPSTVTPPEPPARVEDLERAIRENRGVPALVSPTLPVVHACPDPQQCTCGPAVAGQTPGGVHVLRRSPDGTGE